MSLKNEIQDILVHCPETRGNDIKLIIKYCEKHGYSTDIREWTDLKHNRFESIRRVRQKLQQHNPMLRPDSIIQELREANRQQVRDAIRNY